MTADGKYFYCSTDSDNKLNIYKNNGSGFGFFQMVEAPSNVEDICASDSGEQVMCGVNYSIYVYSQSLNGTYEESAVLNVGSKILRFSCNEASS